MNSWNKSLKNRSYAVIALAVLGALIYGIIVYHNGYLNGIDRGEKANRATRSLESLRGSFLTLKQAGVSLSQSSDKARALEGMENAVQNDRRELTKYVELTSYNEELRNIAPKLMVSFEAWTALELDGPESADREGGAVMGGQRNLSAFLSLLTVLGESEGILQTDVENGASSSRSLLVGTLALIVYLMVLALIWAWSVTANERRQYETVRGLTQMNSTDNLTGLKNRVIFEDRCATAIAGARRYGSSVGILYIDINGLNDVNVKMGYQSGDIVLKESAIRLQQYTREMDTVSRVGEDEFAVLVTNLKQKSDIEIVVDKLTQALTKPLTLSGEEYVPSVSIGAAVFPYDEEDSGRLFNYASSEMLKAKGSGKASAGSVQH